MPFILQLMILVSSPLLVAGSVDDSAGAEKKPFVQAPRFTVPSTLTIPSGGFVLKWTSPDSPVSPRFELQQGTRRSFTAGRIIYAGPDRGTYISGLPNGDFFYRIRAVNAQETRRGQWSSAIHRTVKHPSLGFALSLMSVGAIVFMLTIGMIALGIQREKSG